MSRLLDLFKGIAQGFGALVPAQAFAPAPVHIHPLLGAAEHFTATASAFDAHCETEDIYDLSRRQKRPVPRFSEIELFARPEI